MSSSSKFTSPLVTVELPFQQLVMGLLRQNFGPSIPADKISKSLKTNMITTELEIGIGMRFIKM